MTRVHIVKAGDCISSIAFQYGFNPDTIWQCAENEALRKQRRNPNVLLEGDELFIPELRTREVSLPTDAVHTFRRLAVPEIYRARFLDRQGKPRAGLAYSFYVHGVERRGTLDADGSLSESIPPDLDRAIVELHDPDDPTRQVVLLGQLVPVSELRGVQARLRGLGFECARVDGELDASTRAAIAGFQRTQGLLPTGEPDDQTRARLEEAYGV